MTSKLKLYQDWKFKLSAYQMVLSLLDIDRITVAPPDGNAYRDERTAFLSGELFDISTDRGMMEILQEILSNETLNRDLRKEASLYYKEASDIVCIPRDVYLDYKKLIERSYLIWLKAKYTDDYSLFEPLLREIIESRKVLIGYRKSDKPLYDEMLNDYEPGSSTAFYDPFFETVKERLLPLIERVSKAERIDDSILHRYYPADRQKAFTHEFLLPFLHFEPSWGYQNETEHPFTSWLSQNDCRTTTKYVENDIVSAIFSTIHETGHAWYAHNIDPRYDGSILSYGVSSAMHESQSRFCENYLGRSHAFWEYCYPHLQDYFPAELGEVPLETFYRAVNLSTPSPIRTEADELTYPIHVLIRYEIEKGLFDGSISTERLDQTWNDKYREYLGIEITKASQGLLQDVHWSSGDFGYFPTYALGSAFGAQFYHRMLQDLDVNGALRSGDYLAPISWLKTNIHQYGASLTASEIIQRVCGEAFKPEYYIDYLENKYGELYGLD